MKTEQDERKRTIRDLFEKLMADRTGLEPATSGVTGRHSNQLNYRSTIVIHYMQGANDAL